ncbi:NAD(P)-dependent oxidoreductase [Lichenicoccus sp.]|uniref:NAD(P)-dependent oxidoreductase n=1 Tax=Lichenicoccus sp. TaxID=2781899 RepID=UPI003D0B3FC7
MSIGFIGLGNIGAPMARRLVAAGHDVLVFDLNQAAVERLVGVGAKAGHSVRAIGDRCETVLLSLPAPAIVNEVVLGQDGLISSSVVRHVIDLSTTGSDTAHNIDEGLSRRGIGAVDAPVSGGVSGAEAGTLAIMVACSRQRFEVVEPLLRTLGRVFHVAERPGLGQLMKLINNYLSATSLAVTSEAFVLGLKRGLDPVKMIEVLNAGSGRSSASLDKFPRAILPGTFDLGFTIALMCKDLGLFLDEAKMAGVSLAAGAAIDGAWQNARGELGGDADFSRIVTVLARQAGIDPLPCKEHES